MTVVLHRHARSLGYCNRGMRPWFARIGIDWHGFVRCGVAADELREKAGENAMVERVIAVAERENNGQ